MKSVSIEVAWLVSCYVVAFLMVLNLVRNPPLDIQMHNTYFVLSRSYLTTPLFAAIASAATAVRLATSRWRTGYTKVVMIGLILLWLFMVLIIAWIAIRLRRF
jgi:hypothetical protein